MNTLFENLSPDAQKALSQARSSFEQAGQNGEGSLKTSVSEEKAVKKIETTSSDSLVTIEKKDVTEPKDSTSQKFTPYYSSIAQDYDQYGKIKNRQIELALGDDNTYETFLKTNPNLRDFITNIKDQEALGLLGLKNEPSSVTPEKPISKQRVENTSKKTPENKLESISFQDGENKLFIESGSTITPEDTKTYKMLSKALALKDPEYENLEQYKIDKISTFINKKGVPVELVYVNLPNRNKSVPISKVEIADNVITIGDYSIVEGDKVQKQLVDAINATDKSGKLDSQEWTFVGAQFNKSDLIVNLKNEKGEKYTIPARWIRNNLRNKRGVGRKQGSKEVVFDTPKEEVTVESMFGDI